MKHAETVTFGSSHLNRAAHMRVSKDFSRETFEAKKNYTGIVVYQGKLLVDADSNELARLTGPQKAFDHSGCPPIFLGLEDGNPTLAFDISDWEDPNADTEAMGAFLDPSWNQHPEFPKNYVFKELRSIMAQMTPRDAELAATTRGIFEWHKKHGFCANCGAPTTATKAGWQRDCSACESSHFPRTDPVVIMLVTYGDSVLLGRSPNWPETMFSLLAGFMEPGETVEAAVRRETLEEAGIKVGKVTYLTSQPWCFPSSLMIGCRGYAETTEIEIDPLEIEEARWVTKAELIDEYTKETPNIMPAREGAIAHFLIRNWLKDTLD